MSVGLAIYNALSPILPATGFFRVRRRWLRACGLIVDRNARLASGTRLYDRFISIGEDTWVGFDVTIHSTGHGEIRIGSNVDIGDRACIISGTHVLGTADRRAGPGSGAGILIGDGSWIGANVTIIAGAEIGPGSLVAAGSVVTAGQYPKNALLAGVPAKVKRLLAEPAPERAETVAG